MLKVSRASCTWVISNVSKWPLESKMITTIPSSKPHSSSPWGQFGWSFTFSSAESAGIGWLSVVCE